LKDSIGDKFHDLTKLKRGDTFPPGKRVPAFKVYASPLETIRLPAPKAKGGAGVWSVVAARRSLVPEVGSSITPSEIAQLLWAAQGITGERSATARAALPFRASPSPSGAYPLEAYVLVRDVKDTFAGVYHYVVREHQLEQVRIGDITKDFSSALLGEAGIDVAACAIVLTGVTERVTASHGERGHRYLYLEAGFAKYFVGSHRVGLKCLASQHLLRRRTLVFAGLKWQPRASNVRDFGGAISAFKLE
jgi:SagB-type dehydrogenase family enzyme